MTRLKENTSDGTIPKFLPIPIRFRFYCKISDSDTCKHSMFTRIGIGTTMFNAITPNYFIVLVSC